jgi:hypothetical protein
VIIGRGNWEPILDESTWQAVRAKLGTPRTVDCTDGSRHVVTAKALVQAHTGRKYTLTGGLAVCGVCEVPVVGATKTMRNGQRRAYLMCVQQRGGCGGVGIVLDPTESYVADRLFAELDRPEFLAAVSEDDHAERRDELTRALSALDAQRAELATLWGTGGMSTVEWQAARTGLDQREQKLQAELAAIPVVPARIDISGVREAWPSQTLDEQRALIRLFIERVVINRAKPGTRVFDPARVEIVWRGGRPHIRSA